MNKTLVYKKYEAEVKTTVWKVTDSVMIPLEYKKHKDVVIGKMDQVCQYYGANKFSRETQGMC